MNPKFNKLVDIMEEYDKLPIESSKRTELGIQIDKLGSEAKDRDKIAIICTYQERIKK